VSALAPRWTESSKKHGISQTCVGWAIAHANYTRDLADNGDGSTDRLFVGPEHEQTDREIEVIVRVWMNGSGRESVIFHAMPLGPKIRRMRQEHPDGQ
jgi:hypothetical protein